MIQLDDIGLTFGQQIIFDKVSCSIKPDQKIGLVGRNGSGKTTLLNVIAGNQSLDTGQVCIPKIFRCAFMPQDVVLISKKSILHEVLQVFPQISQLLEELVVLEPCISGNSANNEQHERYAAIYNQLYELDYESKRNQAEQILIGLGFKKNQLEQSVSSLSTGWKMRLVLAGLLLQKADFYLFDEPTNHLDLFAKEWFLEFLRNAPFGFILVSHDEYFLNTVCNTICEVSMGNLTLYKGNYKKYIEQKEVDTAIREKKYGEQQKFIKKQEATIERFRAKATKASMVQSMIKSLEKMKTIELEQKQKSIGFKLPSVQRSGKIVLNVQNLAFSFDSKKIFEHATFQIQRGHKIAIVAPNGTGKTTLMNVIMAKHTQDNGIVSLGHNVAPVYFEQDQNQSLNSENTIIEEVEAICETTEARARVRTLLGAFLFSGDDVYKKIKVLSGGEKNRVAMVKILLQDANFLILDEPTNHLDIISKSILCDVLSSFKGTILFVSHDRTFLNQLATDIFELTPKAIFSYSGNYDSYLYHKKHQTAHNQCNESDKVACYKKSTTKQNHVSEKMHIQRKQIQKTEATIERLEKQAAKIKEQFVMLSYGTQEYDDAITKLHNNKQELEKQYELWEELIKKMDEV